EPGGRVRHLLLPASSRQRPAA
ncbi:MAG: hypothetical protein AVDCRST_MAG72-1292, partial [uncultured Nocardioidaceae bacterium]